MIRIITMRILVTHLLVSAAIPQAAMKHQGLLAGLSNTWGASILFQLDPRGTVLRPPRPAARPGALEPAFAGRP